MTLKNEIVVSRFRENLEWIRSLLKNDWIESIVIYNKGPEEIIPFDDDRIKIKTVPNVGREGGTYLDYIIENYSNLPEKIWFAQGNPMEHSPDFLGLMQKKSVEIYDNRLFQGLSDRWKTSKNIPPAYMVDITNPWQINKNRCIKYFVHSNLQLIGHCAFRDGGIDGCTGSFARFYGDKHIFGYMANLVGMDEPKPITEFFYSACFFVHRNAVLSHPKSSYVRLREFLLESDPQGSFQGYMLERFWPYLFEKRSFKTLTDCYLDVIKGKYIGVYCNIAKKIWIKENVITYIFGVNSNNILFQDQDETKILPALNFHGPDLYIQACNTIEEAAEILRSFIARNS